MEWLVNILSEIGNNGLQLFWLPVAIWTIIALAVTAALRVFEKKISAVYHYHSRVALLWGLAAGVAGTVALWLFPLQGATTSTAGVKFIVIQSPITVTAAAPAASINWSDPALWIGLITSLMLLAAIAAMLKLAANFTHLKSLSQRLSYSNTADRTTISAANNKILQNYDRHIQIILSDDVKVPCTFGLKQKRIVLPRELEDDAQKLNMALRHELAHIGNNDYLINTSVQMVKALFFFHPLVHSLAAGTEEYREIYCDQHVLREADISRKSYAKLLVELSPKSIFKQPSAVNMAIRPSTLKKRIQTMTTQNHHFPSLKWSFSLMLAATLMLTGLMACSDIEEGGITQSEVEDTQMQMDQAPDDQAPLYIINGEEVDPEGDIMARLKPKYIESIDVLKGEKARQEYGEKGANGVINITLSDHEKAMADLRTDEEMQAMKDQRKKGVRADDNKEIFVAVEDAPQLKGGLRGLQKNVEYPESCRRAEIEGRVTLQFVVNKQGDAENVEILRGIGGGCDEAAKEAVEKYAKFEPGMQRGKPVNVQYSLPIFFKLGNNGSQDIDGQDGIEESKLEVRNLSFSGSTVTGTVHDKASNEPLEGANVTIQSTNRGAATNYDGQFTITGVEEESKINISYVGYSSVVADFN